MSLEEELREYQGGKLVLHPWIARGFTAWESVADWFHNGSVEAAKSAMSVTKNHMAPILCLDKLPSLDISKQEVNPKA